MRLKSQHSLLLLAAGLLIASAVSSAPGQRRQPLPGMPPGLIEARLLKEHAKEIGLSEEALTKLDAIMADVKKQEGELRKKAAKVRGDLRALLNKNLPSEKSLIDAAGVVAQVERKTREVTLRCSLRVRGLLTKEQLAKFMKLREEKIASRRKREERRR